MERRSSSNKHPDSAKPRGVRFPPALHARLMRLAAETQRTFSDMVLYATLRGLGAMAQDETDRKAGERARRVREGRP